MFRVPLRDALELRLVQESDADAMFAVVDRNRDYLRQWLLWVERTTSPAAIVDYIRTTLHQFADNRGFAVGIWDGDAYIGGAGFHNIDWPNRKVEMGYWLDREQQGKGIVTLACRALLAHAFHRWRLNRVEIHCAVSNGPSNRVAGRLGFTLEATLREAHLLYGTYHDLNVYALLAREWASLQK